MHQVNLDLSLEEICKIEGAAGLDLSIKDNLVTSCHFKITEYKRFYTQAIRGKSALAAPALLARICGTCSNAHIMTALEAVENALGITPSPQTMTLRRLIINGLIIRDHALHLYLFVLPDLFNKESLLDFDDQDPEQHQLLHDTFDIKDAGNQLSILTGGRSVHAPFPMVGGFVKYPNPAKSPEVITKLKAIRPAVLRLIKIYQDCPFTLERNMPYLATQNNDYSYLTGNIVSSDGVNIEPQNYRKQLKHQKLKYSHASAYTYKDTAYYVGALARMNLNKGSLHNRTQLDSKSALQLFPSKNAHHNNLAQAIEILNAIDDSLDILQKIEFKPEPLQKPSRLSGQGFGIIEAPRGVLYHHLTIENQVVKDAEILVPTGQNQLNIEQDIKLLVENQLRERSAGSELLVSSEPSGDLKAKLEKDIEILIRAYDPCMSCAAHFLKVNWS
jgi:coenzyme F420-reducing hydrogenase alpha subunit